MAATTWQADGTRPAHHPRRPHRRARDADQAEEVPRLEGRFDADHPCPEHDAGRKPDGGRDRHQGRDSGPIGQQRETRHEGGGGAEQDDARDQAEGRAKRDRRQCKASQAWDHLTQELAAAGDRLRPGGGGEGRGQAEQSEQHVEGRMRVAAVAQLIGTDEEIETEWIEGGDRDPGGAK